MSQIAVIGAGLSGAVVARRLAEAGHRVTIFEARSHVAGNCYTQRDATTGIMVQVYGAHLFHTDNETVWKYIQQFDTFEPFIHRNKTTLGGKVYTLPINLHTINQFFGTAMSPAAARDFISGKCLPISEPRTFEDQALAFIGRELYDAFMRGYTIKQWGRDPTELPASILKRLPLRFDYNDAYFDHPYQAMPRHGYTDVVYAILDHQGITINLSAPWNPVFAERYDHIFYSGKLDAWYDYAFGPLAYRTLDFESETKLDCDVQGCAVMNYSDEAVPYTRIIEHKHLMPWERHPHSVIYREYSREAGIADEPYYPVRLANDKSALERYQTLADKEPHVTFIGRLGRYQYIDMHQAIGQALALKI
jgi:UDP-galactopyranose mutase